MASNHCDCAEKLHLRRKHYTALLNQAFKAIFVQGVTNRLLMNSMKQATEYLDELEVAIRNGEVSHENFIRNAIFIWAFFPEEYRPVVVD